jgi:MoaA/NifB/PqqE/SkfB family radical SAM enzyme
MAISYEELTDKHPCYARGKKGSAGRIHLPISPTCNIECRFCDRRINDYEKRPGVSSTVIKPEEAIDVIRRSLELCPAIKVAGIAGPGDTLASDYALETFRLIKKNFPDLVKCMSTNGLLLAEKADEIIAALGTLEAYAAAIVVCEEFNAAIKKFKAKVSDFTAAEAEFKNTLASSLPEQCKTCSLLGL